jgi:hypothetical protein
VKPVTSGNRYTYLGWYSHGSPNVELNEVIIDPIENPQIANLSTNVYMPNLRKDFKNYLETLGAKAPALALSLVESMHS